MRSRLKPEEFGARIIENHEFAVAQEVARLKIDGRVRGLAAPEELRDVLTLAGQPIACVWTRRVDRYFRIETIRYEGRLPWLTGDSRPMSTR